MVVLWRCRYVIGDQSILESTGLTSWNDIDSLSAPAELSGVVNPPRIPGEIDYLICTTAGKGAYVLDGPHLLDSVSGLLPKNIGFFSF